MRYNQIIREESVILPPYLKRAVRNIIDRAAKSYYGDDYEVSDALAYDRVTGSSIAQEDDPDLESIDFDNWLDKNMVAFASAFSSIYKDAAMKIATTYIHDGVITLHRLITLPYDPVQAILAGKRDLGNHWSHTAYTTQADIHAVKGIEVYSDRQAGRENYGSGELTDYVMTVQARAAAIDWTMTLFRMVEFRDFEREVQLGPDIQLKLVSITRGLDTPLDISKIAKIRFKTE